jgi:hypothetical protein
MPKKPRARTERRIGERASHKLVHAKQRLATLQAGGTPDHPVEVSSTSVIPVRARATPCPLCDGTLQLEEETARSATLRGAEVRCVRCGVRRTIWFRVTSPLPS